MNNSENNYSFRLVCNREVISIAESVRLKPTPGCPKFVLSEHFRMSVQLSGQPVLAAQVEAVHRLRQYNPTFRHKVFVHDILLKLFGTGHEWEESA